MGSIGSYTKEAESLSGCSEWAGAASLWASGSMARLIIILQISLQSFFLVFANIVSVYTASASLNVVDSVSPYAGISLTILLLSGFFPAH